MAVGKLKSYESQDADKILAGLIRAGGRGVCSETHIASAAKGVLIIRK
jgi:hypothetical protein